jgi:hypothetical protein
MMKRLLVIFGSTLTSGTFAATAVYTNVQEMMLGLELAQTTVVAGERLKATMTISNASQNNTSLAWESVSLDDTRLGSFVVVDETGLTLPKTVPFYYFRGITDSSGRAAGFGPRSVDSHQADIVWNYSGLTNPGTYSVKAVFHRAPLPNSQPPATFVAETPWVPITVTPRPEGSPPPKELYPEVASMTPDELAEMKAAEARYRELMEEPRRAAMPQVPRVAPRDTRSPLPPKVRATIDVEATGAAGMPAEAETHVFRSRNILYGLAIFFLLAGLGLFLRRSRHKEPGS